MRGRVELSVAGDILAAGPPGDGTNDTSTVRIFSLPSGNEILPVPTDASPGLPVDFTLASGGSRIGLLSGVSLSTARTVTSLDGSLVDFSHTITMSPAFPPWIRLSPDGTLIAVPDGPPEKQTVSTRLYKKSSLINVVAGFPIVAGR